MYAIRATKPDRGGVVGPGSGSARIILEKLAELRADGFHDIKVFRDGQEIDERELKRAAIAQGPD